MRKKKTIVTIVLLTGAFAGAADSQSTRLQGRFAGYSSQSWESQCFTPSYYSYGSGDGSEVVRKFEEYRDCVLGAAENDIRAARGVIARDAAEEIETSRNDAMRALD